MHQLSIIQKDPLLKPYENQFINRVEWYQNTKEYIVNHFGSLERFANAHKFFGFNYDKNKEGWWFREWLPNAHHVTLIGDFNEWNRESHPLKKGNFGTWEIFLSEKEYKNKLTPGSKVKIHVTGNNGSIDRIPAYIKQTIQNEDTSFDGIFTGETSFEWSDKKFKFKKNEKLLIYEAHIGIATEEEKIGSYREFTENILPKIKELGYNAIQLMAIHEHPYYASFGYQVSSFYAPSSRFGTPDDLRYLINKAHQLGIAVILDVVHSHAVKNRNEGLTEFDGTEIYFNGWHPDWDSRTFDYAKIEVKRFLASNLKYWVEEFHFDGFRFDGVTSMLYHHFGHISFNDYSQYFKNTNNDAIIYLQLANDLIHELKPNIISICEDMSGMPGACSPVEEGGLGFDYRLGMGIPDFWFQTIEHKPDEDWNMGQLYWELSRRRPEGKTIAYCESHDQALVGDKTLAFWLMDKHMYEKMGVDNESIIIDRGIALHKMIRLVTSTLGGEAYMNFMGNEFGHPEWIDFPREGNNNSYQYARRQWSLAEKDYLKYQYLLAFDKNMISFLKKSDVLTNQNQYKLYEDNERSLLVFSKSDYLFLFNFGKESLQEFSFNTKQKGKFKVILNSDDKKYGGFDRVDNSMVYETSNDGELKIYLPNRTAIILKKVK